MGFNKFLKSLEPISSITLLLQFKKLQKWDMIEKKTLSTSPHRFKYNFTEKGREFTNIFYYLMEWSYKWNF